MKECKSLVGEQDAVFWTAQLLQEGKVPTFQVEYDQNSPLLFLICSYPSRAFLFSFSTTWFPARLKKWCDCKYNLTLLGWSILELLNICQTTSFHFFPPIYSVPLNWLHKDFLPFPCNSWAFRGFYQFSSFWILFLLNLTVLMKYRKEMKLQAACFLA